MTHHQEAQITRRGPKAHEEHCPAAPQTREAQSSEAHAHAAHAMASSLVAAARRLLRLCRVRSRLLPGLLPRAAASSPCGYSTEKRRPVRPLGLQSTLAPLGHPSTLLVPEIELWAARPGNRIRAVELQRIVKEPASAAAIARPSRLVLPSAHLP